MQFQTTMEELMKANAIRIPITFTDSKGNVMKFNNDEIIGNIFSDIKIESSEPNHAMILTDVNKVI